MTLLQKPSIVRVRDALAQNIQSDTIVELADSARTAAQAADALKVDVGAIVKSLVFTLGTRYVLVLVAGDHQCREDQLERAFFLPGPVAKPGADLVRAVTGFAIGGVAPIGMVHPLPTVIDASLKRFDTLYAAAGHPNAVFSTTVDALKRMTGGTVSYAVGRPA